MGALAENQPWPIAPWAPAYQVWAENDAWFTGNVAALRKAAVAPARAIAQTRAGLTTGGIAGVVGRIAAGARAFWGSVPEAGSTEVQLHIPAAADISSLSARLLFSDPPDFYYPAPEVASQALGNGLLNAAGQPIVPPAPATGVVDGALKARQARLDEIASSDMAKASYLEGGAFTSAFGASAFRLVWDEQTSDSVWFEPLAPDVTVPEFRFGKLVALSCFTEYPVGGSLVYRHVERHEVGAVMHSLYLGTATTLGKLVPLQARAETAPLLGIADATFDGLTLVLATGISRLTAVWWLNQPAREWRKLGPLAEAGRSDYAGGTKGLFDALDGAWSSWMNDLDLGRARLIVPSAFLENQGRGEGATFDRTRSLYAGVNAPGSTTGGIGESIEQVQFDIRVTEHEQTTQALYRRILGSAGLGPIDKESTQSRGENRTATEVNQQDESKEQTRAAKALWAAQAMSELHRTAMLLDGVKFRGKGGGDFGPVTVDFPNQASVDPLQNSTVIANLRAAKVMSVWEGVAAAHPKWKDTDIQLEVDRLKQEGQIADPTTVGNPAQDPEEAARNLPDVATAARQLGLEVTGG